MVFFATANDDDCCAVLPKCEVAARGVLSG